MSKTNMTCTHCGNGFEPGTTVWILRGDPYHPGCIRKNRSLLDAWRAAQWREKDIVEARS